MIRSGQRKKQLDSDSIVKCATVQFYNNSHNFQSDCWIRLKIYVESPDMFYYLRLIFRSIRVWKGIAIRVHKGCTNLLPFDFQTSYLARILFLQGCGSLFWKFPNSTRIFNELQYNLQVWHGFINVSESFSYKDSLFILTT